MGTGRGNKIPLTINKNKTKEFMFGLEQLLGVLYFKTRTKTGELKFDKHKSFDFAIYEVKRQFSELYPESRHFAFEFSQDKQLDIGWAYLPERGIFLRRDRKVFPMDFNTNNTCVRYLENTLSVCKYKKDISLLAVSKDSRDRVSVEMKDLDRGITYILR